jgi:ankyrin repeat protein
VRFLISQGADVNALTEIGDVPKFKRPEDSSGSKGVGIIRSGWPEWGERNPVPGAKTPLLYAARGGHLEIAAMLLEAGADIEQADGNDATPLLTAIITDHMAVAEYLLEQGAFVNARDWYGQTPLFAAVDVRNMDVSGPTRDNGVDREAAMKIIRILLDKGADPNVRTVEYPPQRRFVDRLGSLAWCDFTGQTPFLRAAYAGDVTTMRLLLEYGANPNIPTYSGTTPLMAAAGMNWTVSQTFDEGPEHLLEAVKLAHDLGNDVNAVNYMGMQAIHAAANRGSNDIIQYLVGQGAELNLPDKVGRTPMDWAEGVFLATHPPERKPETITLLQELQSGF